MTSDRIAQIRALNDNLRSTFRGGRILLTPGVTALSATFVSTALLAIQRFDAFEADNDPYAEHDFGSVEVLSQTVFWKIDYYDETLSGGAEDPADATRCARVLTVMLADEY
jgi:hypothetical protein